MKKLLLVSIFSAFFFSSCFVFDFENDGVAKTTPKKKYTSSSLQQMIKEAQFDVSNLMLLRNPDDYRTKVLCLSGTLVEQIYLPDKDRFLGITGKTGDRGFAIMVELDHPPKKQTNIGESVNTISNGKAVRMLVMFKGFEEFIDEYGTKKRLPMADCIAIFENNDINMRDPIWYWDK